VDVRVLEREARVPRADALGGGPGQVGDLLDARAEAGRTDERAVAAREAALGDLVPALVLEVPGEEPAEVRRVEPAAHPLRRAGRGRFGRVEIDLARRAARQLREHLAAALAAGLGEQPVTAVEELRQREVVACVDAWPRAHRGAEARPARLEAVDGDDEGVLPAGGVVPIRVAAAEEDAVLDRDRVQLARAHADQGERPLWARLLLDVEALAVPARPPEPDAGGHEELLPRVGPDGVAEARLVLAALEPVASGRLLVRPARGQ